MLDACISMPSTCHVHYPIIIHLRADDPAVRQSQRRRTSPPRASSVNRPRRTDHQLQQQQQGASMFGPLGFGMGFGGLGGLFSDMQAMAGQPGATSYSYSSSSYTSSGPGGVTYQATHSQRMGPGGVSGAGAALCAVISWWWLVGWLGLHRLWVLHLTIGVVRVRDHDTCYHDLGMGLCGEEIVVKVGSL